MCGLYSFKSPREEVRGLFNYLEEPDFPPRQYVTPGSPMAIVRQGNDGARHFALVRWGFVPSWAKEIQPGKPLINARSETVLEKPTFRNAIRRRRCLIPANGFYEWEGDVPGKKKPWYIHKPGEALMAFGGIWEHWMGPDGSELETAAIITTGANAAVGRFHDRSPLIIDPADFGRWLDTREEDATQVVSLMHPQADDVFEIDETVIARNAPPPRPKAEPPRRQPGGQMDLL